MFDDATVCCDMCQGEISLDELIIERHEDHELSFCSVRCGNEFFARIGSQAKKSSRVAMY